MRLSIIIILLFATLTALGQGKEIRTVEVSDTIVAAYVDRPGEVYILSRSGQFQKFDKDGNLLNLYKSKTTPTLFDPRDGARLFAYTRDLQQYWNLNPSFEVMSVHELDSAFAIDPWMMCPAGDYNLWILDAADNSLKKIDVKKGSVIVEINAPVKSKQNIRMMRDYQGFLFLLDQSEGILIFNSVGKLIRVLPGKNISYFNFLGEELYYPLNGKLVFFDLFSAETRDTSFPANARFVLLTDERHFTVNAKSITIRNVK